MITETFPNGYPDPIVKHWTVMNPELRLRWFVDQDRAILTRQGVGLNRSVVAEWSLPSNAFLYWEEGDTDFDVVISNAPLDVYNMAMVP